MYILINLSCLVFVAKHSDPGVLCNLIWLEDYHSDFSIFPIDSSSFKYFVTPDLIKLYSNFFETTCDHSDRVHLRAILLTACEEMEADDINEWELEYQCRAVTDNSKFYEYNKGSYILKEVPSKRSRSRTFKKLNEVEIIKGAHLKLFTNN